MWCDNHEVIKTCDCGDNWYCPNCGQGGGSSPCRCTPAPQFKQTYLDEELIKQILIEYQEVWEKLSKL